MAEVREGRHVRESTKTPLAAVLALLLAVPGSGLPQAQPPKPKDLPVFESGTATVVLDVVIRDKRGRAVPDIRPEELEVLEEGARQKVEGFRFVQTEAPTLEGATAPSRPDPTRHLNLVSFVFDQLGMEGRKLANKAALAILEKGLRPNTFMAVFQIDQRLTLVQPFTNDPAKLRAAIGGATSGTTKGITDEQTAMQVANEELSRSLAGAPEATSGEGAPAGASGGGFSGAAQAQALSNMLRMSNTLQRQQLGTTSLYPLLALVRGHETLAGRKSLVYLSEGLQVPPNLDQVFRSTISAANRANVSVYAIDARGLTTERESGATTAALNEAMSASQLNTMRRGGAVTKGEILAADTAEDALRLNTRSTLGDFAEGTGGFLVANTNDFKRGAEQLASDLSGYYEITYTPPPAPYDGRFRALEVKVARKGVDVQSRAGYFALPAGQSSAMFAYEVPLLGALDLDPPPSSFELRAGAFHFDGGPGGREHRLLVEIPIANLKMVTDDVNKSYKVHFSVLAVVKDERGAIVERFSEDYPFTGPLEKAEGLKLGNIVLKRRFNLPPGRFTLQVAGLDREQGKTSVVRTALEVPPEGAGPRMSSLALIRRVEPVAPAGGAAERTDDPFDVGGVRVVPSLGSAISAAANPKLSIFFIAYPGTAAEKPAMTLEFWRDGKALGRAQPELPAPEADGKIRYVGTFPIASFTPGQYEVRVALNGASGSCEERSGFTIAP